MEPIVQSGAGLLYDKVAFDQRVSHDDGYGNQVDEWVEQFTRRAQLIYLRGSESVLAERLESRQPVVVRIRKSADTMRINEDWQMRNARTGEALNIRTVSYDVSRGMIDLLCETGVNPG